MAKKNWFIPSLVIIGLICIGLSLLLSTRSINTIFKQKPLIKVEVSFGKVSLIRHGLSQKETLTGRASLYLLDSIETGTDGDVTLTTDSGYKIRLLENALITIDQEQNKIVLLIKKGELQFDASGQEGSLLVSREGNRWTPAEYEAQVRSEIDLDALPDFNPSASPAPPAGVPLEGLSPEQIQDTLRNNRSAFFRCYTQLLQKKPGTTGQSNLSFTIEPSGKISLINIASSTIDDPQFQRCLIETLRRISFKSFNGKAISTIFPLKFE